MEIIIAIVEYVAAVTGLPSYLVHAVALLIVSALAYFGVISPKARKRLAKVLRKASDKLKRGGPAAAVLFGAVILSACANPGGRLGETDMRSEFQNVPDIVRAIGDACPDCSGEVYTAALSAIPAAITYRDGKDKADINANLAIGGGGFTYSAADETATAPADVRARITEAAGDDAVQAIERVFPGGLSGLIDTIRGGK